MYEKLGFKPQYELTRFAGSLSEGANSPSTPQVRAVQRSDYESILGLDREVTCTDRQKFLLRLFGEQPDDVRLFERDGEIEGYLAQRAGSDEIQIGPCIAATDAGRSLLFDVCRRLAGRHVYLDLPNTNELAVPFAKAVGLTPQRTLLRMCRGSQVVDDCARLWASSGPELG
jgi:hypothetical protein